jgi:hypothetical protein
MFFSQIELDLSQFATLLRYSIVVILLIISFFSMILPLFKYLSGQVTLPRIFSPVTRALKNSDAKPPQGFAKHLKLIETAAPNANPEIWWEYAKAEMTEAEVALAEAKLARKPDPV